MLFQTTRPLTRRQSVLFVGVYFPAFYLLVGAALRQGGADIAARVVWTTGACVGVAGLIVPGVSRGVYRALMWLTLPLGFILSYAILFTLYFAVITPVGWLMRCFHDPMHRQFDREARTYWIPRGSAAPDRYFRQF